MTPMTIPAATILIVDDTSENITVLRQLLNAQGYRTRPAINGDVALHVARHTRPDLILLDIRMPGLDGFEVCRHLKADERLRDIPVIFLSALEETSDKVKAFTLGGVDYITKPFHAEEVLARVHIHLTLRRQQHEIETQRDQLRTLNASKDKFFSILADDLKNPLNTFLSFGRLLEQMLAAGELVQLKTLTGHFRTAVKVLFAMLENLLTWAQLQQGMLQPWPQEIAVRAFADRNVKLLQPQAEHKQITLNNLIPTDLLVTIDVPMIDTVVRNLLANAIKFTNSGGTVTLAADQDPEMVTVSITDTGIGISPAQCTHLFRIDTKCQRDGTAGEKGTGLGLILCKEFVEKNGGQIWVESDVGKGTTLRFTLPRRADRPVA
jgi:two-component system, sensor histidine kinase and response regulator